MFKEWDCLEMTISLHENRGLNIFGLEWIWQKSKYRMANTEMVKNKESNIFTMENRRLQEYSY